MGNIGLSPACRETTQTNKPPKHYTNVSSSLKKIYETYLKGQCPHKSKSTNRLGVHGLPRGDFFLSGISICASPNLDILGVKFDSRLTYEDHVHGIVSRVSQRIGILRLVKRIFVDTSVLLRCYYGFVLPILKYCSPV